MKSRVLLIDDSITIHRVIDLSLDLDMYELEKAFTYEEAIAKMKNFTPDIVLIDNKLEGTNVKELIREIKSKCPAKVVLLVGAFDNFDASKMPDFNCDDYLVKPFNSQTLEDKLGNLLPPKENEDIVVEVQEKDAAVEELMSKISQDIASFEEHEEAGASSTLESTDLSLGLDMSQGVEETSKIGISEEEKEEKIDLESLFSGLEEVDADLLFEETKKYDSSDKEGSLEKVEEEIDSVKYDKTDLFNDMLAGKDFESKMQPTVEENATSNTLELEIEQEEESLDELLHEAELEEDNEYAAVEGITHTESMVELTLEEMGKKIVAEKTETPVTGVVQVISLGEDAIEKAVEKSIKSAISSLPVTDEIIKKAVMEVINEDMLKGIIKECFGKILEKVVWDVVPELAEHLIIAEIEKIKSMGK